MGFAIRSRFGVVVASLLGCLFVALLESLPEPSPPSIGSAPTGTDGHAEQRPIDCTKDLFGGTPINTPVSALGGLPCDPPPPPPPPPVRVGGSVRAPVKTKHVRPTYPAEARGSGIRGTVVIEVVVATDGRVIDTKVLRSIPRLDEAALDAVRLWEFKPTVVEGVARPLLLTVDVRVSP